MVWLRGAELNARPLEPDPASMMDQPA